MSSKHSEVGTITFEILILDPRRPRNRRNFPDLAGGYSRLTMVVPNVATSKVAKTVEKSIQYESRQSSAALMPNTANATSTIAIATHRKPPRDGVIVTLTKPTDIVSIEAIAATTDRNSKTARLTV